MARKTWDSLSPKYRQRLERGGISRRDYESGASLAKARGHQNTPEHPRDIERQKGRTRYREYQDRKKELIDLIQEYKRDWYDSRAKWNEEGSLKTIRHDPRTGKERGVKELRDILKYIERWVELDIIGDGPDWMDEISDEDFASAFFYH